eukprot:6206662-Pleurochrysis_carterae.AAC.1
MQCKAKGTHAHVCVCQSKRTVHSTKTASAAVWKLQRGCGGLIPALLLLTLMSPPSDALAQLHSRCQDARKATNPRSAATLPIVQSASLPTLPSAPLLHRKRSDLSPPSSDRLSPTSRPEQKVVHGGVQHMHGLQWRGRALHPVMTHHDEKEGNAEHAHETHGLFEDISEGFVEGIESAVESVSEAVETGLEMWAEQEERSVEMADESNLPVDTVLAIDSVVVTAVVQSNSTADISYKRFNQLVVAASVSLSLAWVGTSVSSYLAANAIAATPMASLTAIPAVLWQSYQTAVAAAPVPTKAALTGVTYVFGDAVAQTVALRAQNKSAWSMDPYRYARNGVVGLVLLGPLAHYYYDFVADNFADWPIFLKIGLDQTLYLAFYNTIYYVVLGLLAGQSLEKVWSNYMSQFTQLLVAGWKLWPAVGLITYTVIPTVHR